MELIGWLPGGIAKARGQLGKWDDLNQCWYVPPPYQPIESLIEIVRTIGHRRSEIEAYFREAVA
jgi:hypothetical protein